MKTFLLIFFLTISFNSYSQNNTKTSDWNSGLFNKRVLQTHYHKSKADSLSKLVNNYVDGFYCQGSKCKFSQIDEDYYISVKMNNGYLKIKYYFGDYDVLKMDELIPKIEHFLDAK